MTGPRKRATAAWLELARRHRQHHVDEQAPALQAAREKERASDAALDAARRDLDAALAGQRQAAGAASLSTDLLQLHASHCSRLHGATQQAAQAAQAARASADALRAHVARNLSERDAFQQRLDDQADAARLEAERRAVRTLDELWSLGGTTHSQSSVHDEGAKRAD